MLIENVEKCLRKYGKRISKHEGSVMWFTNSDEVIIRLLADMHVYCDFYNIRFDDMLAKAQTEYEVPR